MRFRQHPELSHLHFLRDLPFMVWCNFRAKRRRRPFRISSNELSALDFWMQTLVDKFGFFTFQIVWRRPHRRSCRNRVMIKVPQRSPRRIFQAEHCCISFNYFLVCWGKQRKSKDIFQHVKTSRLIKLLGSRFIFMGWKSRRFFQNWFGKNREFFMWL